MYKVKISNCNGNEFETEMPTMPRIGETVGYWANDEWNTYQVTDIVYEFDRSGKYVIAEINV